MYQLKVKDHFDAAHFIKDYPGKCSRMHGHRWDVEVCLQGGTLGKLNMLIDFVVVKEIMKSLLGKLDHYVLNEQLHEENLTAEFLAKEIYKEFEYKLSRVGDEPAGVGLKSVTIWESPECMVMYTEDDSKEFDVRQLESAVRQCRS